MFSVLSSFTLNRFWKYLVAWLFRRLARLGGGVEVDDVNFPCSQHAARKTE